VSVTEECHVRARGLCAQQQQQQKQLQLHSNISSKNSGTSQTAADVPLRASMPYCARL